MTRAPLAAAEEMRLLKIAAAIVLGVVCFGMAVALLLVSRAIDQRALRDEQALVERRVERSLTSITENITSATVWDDAVQAVGRRDLDWMQLNFGDYYADYMHHAVTLVFAGDGTLLQASRDSEPVAPAGEAAFIAASRPLVDKVRKASAAPDRRAGFGFAAVSAQAEIIRVGEDLYLAAAATVVPEGPDVPRPAQDAVVVSAKPLGVLVESLELDLGLGKPEATPLEAPRLATLADGDGAPLAGLTWAPNRPGRQVLSTLVPVFAALSIAFLIASALLWRRVAANVKRLSDSEAALEAALEAAEGANVAKTRFLANMSHELRTPLNGVLGMAEVVLMSGLTPTQREQMGVIKQSGEHLLGLIDRILEIAQMERALSPPAAAPFDPAEVFNAAAAPLRSKAAAKGLAVTPPLPPAGLRLGDAERLSKALRPLIENAVQFTPQGSIALTLDQTEAEVTFCVADTGVGLTDQTQARLFQPFSQGDDSATRSVDGAGLGLALAKRLADSLGGDITYETAAGQGSTFRLRVPLPRTAEA